MFRQVCAEKFLGTPVCLVQQSGLLCRKGESLQGESKLVIEAALQRARWPDTGGLRGDYSLHKYPEKKEAEPQASLE